MSLSPEDFRAFSEERVKKMIEAGKPPTYIVASFLQVFNDEKLVNCAVCDVPVFLSPFLLEAAEKHKIPVVCSCCVDPQVVKGQMVNYQPLKGLACT